MDTFKCGKCKLVLPSGEFPPSQQGNGKWCKACYREWHRSRYTPSTGATDEPRACAVCHVVYSPSARRLSKFCSVACKNAAKNASHTADLHAAKPARTCVWCAADMPQTMRSDAKYCSADCNMQAHRRTRNYRRRAGAGAPVKPRKQPLVNLADIAARDKFRCGICGQRVDMGRKYPDPGFPSRPCDAVVGWWRCVGPVEPAPGSSSLQRDPARQGHFAASSHVTALRGRLPIPIGGPLWPDWKCCSVNVPATCRVVWPTG